MAWWQLSCIQLIRKVSAVKSRSVRKRVQRLGWDKTVQVVHPSVSVILCTDFSSSDFAVALCEEAVEFMLTDSGLYSGPFCGCSSPLFSPLFLLDPFDSVLSFFKNCSSTCSDGDSVTVKKKKKKKKKKKDER